VSSFVTRQGNDLRGLSWLNFFVADVQTGFGPFIAAYLTEHKWTEGEIGLALSVGTATAMASQIPAGAFVDALTGKRLAATLAILAISLSAVLLASSPTWIPVLIAEVMHGFASCMLSPAIAAISLVLVGQSGLSERLGRNARWAAVGNGLAAAAMGWLGDIASARAVFWFTASLGIPSIGSLFAIGAAKESRDVAEPAVRDRPQPARISLRILFTDRRLLIFAGCVLLFQLSNAAMLNLAAGEATAQVVDNVQLIIAACIIVPQAAVALLSPWVGRAAGRFGRRPVLILGLVALPIRALLFCVVDDPDLLVPIQLLDGVGGAMMGVMLPLIAADVAGKSGHFNLCIGAIGFAGGIGATISTSMAGLIADWFDPQVAFLALAVAGLGAVLLAWAAMPESRADGATTPGTSTDGKFVRSTSAAG
jgi:MFS family permease